MDNKLISKSFIWMCVGLLITFATGIFISSSEVMIENVYGGAYWLFVICEFILVIVMSARVTKMKPTTARICFILYSFFSGLTFSSVFVVYNITSIILVFLVSALIFGLMALFGYTTNIDLTKIGNICLFGLLAIIIVSLINIFIGSTILELILSIICVIIFFGITAYDIQKIKALSYSNIPEDNLAIYGALELYLDFINIFIHLLSIFGDRD